jgi:hypothetical protein
MVLKPEDFDRLRKNVHAVNTGTAKVGDHIHNQHERREMPSHESAERGTQTGNALYKRFYGHGKP